jgi:hypothetical protein
MEGTKKTYFICYFRQKKKGVNPTYNMNVYVTKRTASSFPGKTRQCITIAWEIKRMCWLKNTHIVPSEAQNWRRTNECRCHRAPMPGNEGNA